MRHVATGGVVVGRHCAVQGRVRFGVGDDDERRQSALRASLVRVGLR